MDALAILEDPSIGENTDNRKAPELMSGEEKCAKQFALEEMATKEGNNLKLSKAYEQYVCFCDLKNMEALPRNCFRKPAAAAVRDKFGIALRTDLKVDGKWTAAWKNVDTCLAVAS